MNCLSSQTVSVWAEFWSVVKGIMDLIVYQISSILEQLVGRYELFSQEKYNLKSPYLTTIGSIVFGCGCLDATNYGIRINCYRHIFLICHRKLLVPMVHANGCLNCAIWIMWFCFSL